MPQNPQWELQWRKDVGGLTGIGFSEDESLILVMSHNGRGVFETTSGERVARDHKESSIDNNWWNEEKSTVIGIGPLEGQQIPVVGLWGGQLKTRSGNWEIRIEHGNGIDIVWAISDSGTANQALTKSVTEIRASGFSPNSKYLIVATSSDLYLFTRTG